MEFALVESFRETCAAVACGCCDSDSASCDCGCDSGDVGQPRAGERANASETGTSGGKDATRALVSPDGDGHN